jgi:hypothetical protein
MITNAAFNGVIGQSRTSHGRGRDQVAKFREWVLNMTVPKICGQKAMHNYFPDVWVGHVESLAKDLETVLVSYGYTLPESPIVFEEEHCITSCGKNSTGSKSVGEGSGSTVPQGLEWYDEPTRQRVVEWFAHDFEAFDISTTPPRTFDGTLD